MKLSLPPKTSLSIIAAIGCLLIASCGGDTNTGESELNTVSVKTEKVFFKQTSRNITVSGTTEGQTTVKLGFMVSGKIKKIFFHVGEFVDQGQLIAELDAGNYLINKTLADVQVNEAMDEFKRLKILHDRGSLSDGDFLKAEFSLQRAREQQKLEIKNLSDTRIYAPISGIFLSKQTEAGEIISSGLPLFSLAAIKTISVMVSIPENEIRNIHIGSEAQVYLSALSKSYTGKITEIGALADASSRAFSTKITLENSALDIRPGMIAEANINTKQLRSALLVPLACIMNESGNNTSVFVADMKRKQAFKRNVTVGPIVNGEIEISSGLSDGDLLITSGQTKLSNGTRISVSK